MIPTIWSPSFIPLPLKYMNASILTSILLTGIGGLLAITGSSLLWIVVIVFPIFVWIRIFRIPVTENPMKWIQYAVILFFVIFIFFSLGQIVVIVYSFLIIAILWKLRYKDPAYSLSIVIVALIVSILISIIVSILMQSNTKITPPTVSQNNTNTQTGGL